VFVFIRDANITREVEGIMQEVRIKTEESLPQRDGQHLDKVLILSSYQAR
jgi:hypothetical protein